MRYCDYAANKYGDSREDHDERHPDFLAEFIDVVVSHGFIVRAVASSGEQRIKCLRLQSDQLCRA